MPCLWDRDYVILITRFAENVPSALRVPYYSGKWLREQSIRIPQLFGQAQEIEVSYSCLFCNTDYFYLPE